MQKILFVCLGNICRSPLAEGIMLKLIHEKNIQLEVDSAGTSDFHIGEMPDLRTIENAKNHGVNLTTLRARQFSEKDFDTFDKIYVMDQSNFTNVLALCKNDEQSQKVDLLLNTIYPGKNLQVPDPYFGGEEGFEKVFKMVNEACLKIITIQKNEL
ncbi:MAG: low molecular weight protein-tyrosine-phosphatase [Bacteroidota bacterium]